MQLELQVRPFAFDLTRPLRTAVGLIKTRRGWLLRLRADNGRVGWGEAAPLNPRHAEQAEQAIRALPSQLTQMDQSKTLLYFFFLYVFLFVANDLCFL